MKRSTIILLITGVLCAIISVICIISAAVRLADMGINFADTNINGHEFVWDTNNEWGCVSKTAGETTTAGGSVTYDDSSENVDVNLPFLTVHVEDGNVVVDMPGINVDVDDSTNKVHVKIGDEEATSTASAEHAQETTETTQG